MQPGGRRFQRLPDPLRIGERRAFDQHPQQHQQGHAPHRPEHHAPARAEQRDRQHRFNNQTDDQDGPGAFEEEHEGAKEQES